MMFFCLPRIANVGRVKTCDSDESENDNENDHDWSYFQDKKGKMSGHIQVTPRRCKALSKMSFTIQVREKTKTIQETIYLYFALIISVFRKRKETYQMESM